MVKATRVQYIAVTPIQQLTRIAMARRNHYHVYVIELSKDVLHEGFNQMSYDEACDREVEVGIDLREAGFGLWQA